MSFHNIIAKQRLTTVTVSQIVGKTESKLKSLQRKKSPSREQIEKEEQVAI